MARSIRNVRNPADPTRRIRAYRVEEVAALLDVSPGLVKRALVSGELEGWKNPERHGRGGVLVNWSWRVLGRSVEDWARSKAAQWRASAKPGRNGYRAAESIHGSGDVAAVRTYWQEAQARSRARRAAGTRPGRGVHLRRGAPNRPGGASPAAVREPEAPEVGGDGPAAGGS